MEKESDGKTCSCQGKSCEVCTFLEEKNTFTSKEGSDEYNIRKGLHLDCNSEYVICLIIYKKCKKQYIESCLIRLRTRLNDYHSCHRKFCRDRSVIQVSFYAHFV